MPRTRSSARMIWALLTALTAALILATTITTANARNLSFSSQTIRATFASLEFATESVTMRCPVTLEGSFHTRTIAKIRETLIGAITRAPIKEESCTNGRARTKNFPWHLTYEGFTGTLPNITGMQDLISRFRFELIVAGVCTADYGLETDNITGQVTREGGGAITSVGPIAGRSVANRVAGTGLCTPRGSFSGSGTVTVLNSGSRITITLI